jgi:hypothetical protein
MTGDVLRAVEYLPDARACVALEYSRAAGGWTWRVIGRRASGGAFPTRRTAYHDARRRLAEDSADVMTPGPGDGRRGPCPDRIAPQRRTS